MTYFLIAGEASGDQHAAALMREIRLTDPEARFAGLGGDAMRAEGCRLYQDYRKMAFMGFVAVLRNLSKVRANFRIAREALLKEQPDQLILVDYPSFNLRMANFCKKALPSTRIVYYIPPKAWAWKPWRVHKIARLSDEIRCIFPFEPAFYASYGYSPETGHDIRYVGNPTMKAVEAYKEAHPAVERDNMIAILPGSRRSEISHCLPTMIAAARRAAQTLAEGDKPTICIAGAPGIEPTFYERYAMGEKVVFGESYRLMQTARVAIVNSGTATLETALFGCPQVAVYHLAFPHLVAILRPPFQHMVFRLPYFTLPNIIMEREVIKELVANDFTEQNVSEELHRLLSDSDYLARQQADYTALHMLLSEC